MSQSDQWRRFLINEPQFQYLSQDDKSSEVYSLSLPVSFPGKSVALHELDVRKTNFQRSDLLARRHEAARLVAQTYLDCAGAKASSLIYLETIQDLETLSRTLDVMYENGHSTQAERIGTELQLRQTQTDQRMSLDKVEVNCQKFSRLLHLENIATNEKLEIPEDLPKSVLNMLDEQTADQLRSSSAAALAEATIQTAFWSQLPDISLSMNKNHYIRTSASPSGEDWTTTFGIAITIPIFFPFYEHKEAQRTKSLALIDKDTAELQKQAAHIDEEDARRQYLRDKKRLQELRSRDLSLAETLVESTYSAYKSGKLGFAELMTSRKTLADLKNQELSLRISVISAHLKCLSRCQRAINNP